MRRSDNAEAAQDEQALPRRGRRNLRARDKVLISPLPQATVEPRQISSIHQPMIIIFRSHPAVAAVERQLDMQFRDRLLDDELDELPHLIDDASVELFESPGATPSTGRCRTRCARNSAARDGRRISKSSAITPAIPTRIGAPSTSTFAARKAAGCTASKCSGGSWSARFAAFIRKPCSPSPIARPLRLRRPAPQPRQRRIQRLQKRCPVSPLARKPEKHFPIWISAAPGWPMSQRERSPLLNPGPVRSRRRSDCATPARLPRRSCPRPQRECCGEGRRHEPRGRVPAARSA